MQKIKKTGKARCEGSNTKPISDIVVVILFLDIQFFFMEEMDIQRRDRKESEGKEETTTGYAA